MSKPIHARVRRFAEATGTLAPRQTDRVDAVVLARFGALLQPNVTPPRSDAIDHLTELIAARLVRDRTATTNRAKTLTIGSSAMAARACASRASSCCAICRSR